MLSRLLLCAAACFVVSAANAEDKKINLAPPPHTDPLPPYTAPKPAPSYTPPGPPQTVQPTGGLKPVPWVGAQIPISGPKTSGAGRAD